MRQVNYVYIVGHNVSGGCWFCTPTAYVSADEAMAKVEEYRAGESKPYTQRFEVKLQYPAGHETALHLKEQCKQAALLLLDRLLDSTTDYEPHFKPQQARTAEIIEQLRKYIEST